MRDYWFHRPNRRVVLFLLILALVSGWTESSISAQEDLSKDSEQSGWVGAKELFPGVVYQKWIREVPRTIQVHAVRMDTKTEGLRFFTTVPCGSPVLGKEETKRETVRDFIRRSQATSKKLALAINADFFQPWPVPFAKEDRTDIGGLAISEGTLVSKPAATPSFLVLKSNEVQIRVVGSDESLDAIRTAVSGFAFCLKDGELPPGGNDLNPRTGIGVSKDNRWVYWILVDGRQKESLGVTTQELGQLLLELGAHQGINMDGGGSSTLAWWNSASEESDKCELLNRPVGNGRRWMSTTETYVPSERANGNNLGVYFEH